MFTKLLKHEWKSNSKLLLTLSAFMLGIALLSGLDLRLIISTANNPEAQSDLMALVMIPAGLFLMVAFLALTIYAAAVEFYLLYRFYKSRFTDEGYLTFTLPVKTSHIFLSTALHNFIWMLLSLLVLIASVCIFIFAGVPATDGFATYQEIWNGICEAFQLYSEIIPVENYLYILPITLVSGIILPMSCIVVGAVVAKKLKVLAAIGIMYGCSALSSVVGGMITAITAVMWEQGIIATEAMEIIMPISTAITPVLLAIFGYALSIYLMKNKLNLP